MLFACRIGIAESNLLKTFLRCISGLRIFTCIPIHVFGPILAGLLRIRMANQNKK